MNAYQSSLDQDFSVEKLYNASGGKRFLNYLIDLLVFYFMAFLIGFIAAITGSAAIVNNPAFYLFLYMLWVLYYSIMESTSGKTLGKMVTKTKVIDKNGNTPGFGVVFLRTLSRLVPFEFLSLAFDNEQRMWHDKWTRTRVVSH